MPKGCLATRFVNLPDFDSIGVAVMTGAASSIVSLVDLYPSSRGLLVMSKRVDSGE